MAKEAPAFVDPSGVIKKTRQTVVIACKYPLGLELRLQREHHTMDPMPGGGLKPVKEMRFIENLAFTVKGPAHEPNEPPKGPMVGGYVLTMGCPKEFWDRWHEQNKSSDLVKNGHIFAHGKRATVEGQAKEQKKTLTGLEGLDPTMKRVGDRLVPADPRFPAPMTRNLTETGTGTRE